MKLWRLTYSVGMNLTWTFCLCPGRRDPVGGIISNVRGLSLSLRTLRLKCIGTWRSPCNTTQEWYTHSIVQVIRSSKVLEIQSLHISCLINLIRQFDQGKITKKFGLRCIYTVYRQKPWNMYSNEKQLISYFLFLLLKEKEMLNKLIKK